MKILLSSIRRNLVENGRKLSEVIFFAKTSNAEDLAYLDTLLLTSKATEKSL